MHRRFHKRRWTLTCFLAAMVILPTAAVLQKDNDAQNKSAAHAYAEGTFTFLHGLGGRMSEVGVIARFRAVSAEILYIVTQRAHILNYFQFKVVAGVVAGKCYFSHD